mgnify:CR=1 FL=1
MHRPGLVSVAVTVSLAVVATTLAASAPARWLEPAGATQGGSEFIALQGDLIDRTGSAGRSTVQVTGVAGVPTSGVAAVQVTVTAINWSADGLVSAWPDPSVTTPAASTGILPVPAGEMTTNTAIVALASTGSFQLYQDHVGRVAVSLQGYFSTASSGGGFQPITPRSLVDTQAASPPTPQAGLPAGQPIGFDQQVTIRQQGDQQAFDQRCLADDLRRKPDSQAAEGIVQARDVRSGSGIARNIHGVLVVQARSTGNPAKGSQAPATSR